jgi:hypothetical protein
MSQLSQKYEKSNISIELIPTNMMGISQPLDIVVNKSFQDTFVYNFDVFIAKALESTAMQTKQGDPKVPSYETVSNWVMEWAESFDRMYLQSTIYTYHCFQFWTVMTWLILKIFSKHCKVFFESSANKFGAFFTLSLH